MDDTTARGRRRAGPVLAVLMVVLVAVAALTAVAHPSAADGGSAPTDPCAPTSLLVNPCRPWLGAVADQYPGAGGFQGQLLAHEKRIGRKVDVVHGYHPAGDVTLSSDERSIAASGRILYLNWKPADVWANAAGGNAGVNAQIDTMAAQIKSLGSTKVMLGVFGEPERYVTPGTSTCPGLHGTSGSPADYLAMWANVQARFAAAGVTNVVWVMNYLGYSGWNCLFPALWPGNARVDWIMWDPYIGPGELWNNLVGYFYNALTNRSDATHDYLSKPWGLAEFGYWYGPNQAEAYRMYDDAKAALDSGRYPLLKLYEPFDTISGTTDTRIGYTTAGVADPVEQQHYDALANDPAFTNPVAATTTTSTSTPTSAGPTTSTTVPTTTTTVPTTTTTVPPTTTAPTTTTTRPATTTTTTAPVVTDQLVGCDPTVESGLSCFGGTYASPVSPTLQGADSAGPGTHCVQVTNTTGSVGQYGLNLRPAPVTATAVGRMYAASVSVKASRIGLPVTLLLREKRANGTAPANGYTLVTWTATDTNWNVLSATYIGKEAGNGLTFSVYGSQMAAGQWIRADSFVLTSTLST